MQSITQDRIVFDKNVYNFNHVREAEITAEYYRAWKDAGKMPAVPAEDELFGEPCADVLQRFLQDCFHADGLTGGTIVAPMYRKNDGFRIFVADATKNCPKRPSTVRLSEQFLNFSSLNRGDYFLKTDLFFHSDMNSYSARNIRSCCAMMIDIDDCSDMYTLPIERWQTYVFQKYPLFRRFVPTYLLASGNKGFHAIYAFDNDAHDHSGIFQMINNLLAIMFEADMVRVGAYNSTRLPYSVNQKTGREARIFHRGAVLRYEEFRDNVLSYADDKQLARRLDTAGPREYDKYVHGVAGQVRYTDGICKHYLADKLTEEIASDNYSVLESMLESYLRNYGGPKEKNCKDVKDKELFHKYRALTTVQHPEKEENYSTWGAMLHDEKFPLYLRARFFDIHRTIHESAGNMIGFRNNTLTIVANTIRLMGCSQNFCDFMMHHYNDYFTTPLKESEIQAILRYQYHHLVFFNNMKIADMLGLSDCVMEHSLVSYTKEQKNKRAAKYEKSRLSARRKERGYAKKRTEQLVAFAEALDSCSGMKEVLQASGQSKTNAYRLLKEYPFLKAIKDGTGTLEEAKEEIRQLGRAKKAGRKGFDAWKAGQDFILEEEDRDEEEQGYDEYGYDIDLTKNEGLYADADEAAAEEGLPSIDMQIAEEQKYMNQYQVDKDLGESHGLSSMETFIKEVSAAMDRCVQETRREMREREERLREQQEQYRLRQLAMSGA